MVIKEKNDDLVSLKNKRLSIDRGGLPKNNTLTKREIGGRGGWIPQDMVIGRKMVGASIFD